ncbi:MAG: DUF3552 domain-containing protein, partial [Candidatus Omnitrophica bacterium]|nr:DUF3552 domain-containing protein [Candidatus Omnitrophota bacterium]
MDRAVNINDIGFAILGGVFLFILRYVLRKYTASMKIKIAEDKAKTIITQAKVESERKSREAALEAKDLLLKMRMEFEQETKDRRREITVMEKRLLGKEESLDKKLEIIEQKAKDLKNSETEISAKKAEIDKKKENLEQVLLDEKMKIQDISGMTKEQAKETLMQKMLDEARSE